MVNINEFSDKSILDKNLNPTPPDIWDLALKLDNIFELGKIAPYNYFSSEDRITLDMSNAYFAELIKFMVDNYDSNIEEINNIVNSYQNIQISNEHASLLDMLLHLKDIRKCPAIIFQENSTSCMRIVRTFAKQIEEAEQAKYPDMINERLKHNKKAKKIEKENDSKKN